MLCYGSRVNKEFRLSGTLFNGKPFVASRLFCFVFVFMLPLSRGLLFNRRSKCRRPDSHTCLFFLLFFFFGDVAFSEYLVPLLFY